jgi:hypothetical protein
MAKCWLEKRPIIEKRIPETGRIELFINDLLDWQFAVQKAAPG